MDIAAIAPNLSKDAEGIWIASGQGEVSYPSEGNESYFEVEETSFWFRHRNNVITHLVREYSPEKTFFDIGGGNGCVSKALQGVGVDTVLVEPGPQGARNAKQRGVASVIQSTLKDAGFRSGTLPSAGIFDVLEHIELDLNFLQDIYTYLQPRARLYITVPAYGFLWSADDTYAGHIRRYSASSLSLRLMEAGFELTYWSYLFSFLVPAIFLLRSIPSRVGVRKSVSTATTKKEHSIRPGAAGYLLKKCLDLELCRIRDGNRLPVGSSCLAIATKPG